MLDGIRRVATLMGQRRLKICETCEGLIGEISGDIWDEKASLNGVERPVKQNDHGVDAARYLVATTIPGWRFGEG